MISNVSKGVIEGMAEMAAADLLEGNIPEADDLYTNEIGERIHNWSAPWIARSQPLFYMLVIFALVIDSEDARYKFRAMLFSGNTKLAWRIRALNRWWFYPILLFTDVPLLWNGDLKSKQIAKLKYPTPISWILTKGNK